MTQSVAVPPDRQADPDAPLTQEREDSITGMWRDWEIVRKLQRTLGTEDEDAVLATENIAHLLRAYILVSERLNDSLSPYGLSLAKYNLLIVLRYADEYRLPMSEIGGRMSVTCANITKLVDGLEQDGFVRRVGRPGDRRVVLAELTDEGRALLERIQPEHYLRVKRMMSGLNAEEHLQLTHLLIKLRQSVRNSFDS